MTKRMRFLTFIGFALIIVMVPMIANLPIKLIYNASASAPIGFYRVTPASGLKRGGVCRRSDAARLQDDGGKKTLSTL